VDGGVAVDLAWNVSQSAVHIEGDLDVLDVRIIKADGRHEGEQGDTQVILCLNERRQGICELNLSLQHIESRDRAGIIAALLVSDLGLVEGYLLLIGNDQCAIKDDLVKLLDDGGDGGVDGLAERVVGDLLGKLRCNRVGNRLAAIVQKLGSLELDVPRIRVCRGIQGAEALAQRGHLSVGQLGLLPLKGGGGPGNTELWQESGADSNEISRSLPDRADGGENLRIFLQGELHGIVDGELAGILGNDSWNDSLSRLGQVIRSQRNVTYLVLEAKVIGAGCRQRNGTRGGRWQGSGKHARLDRVGDRCGSRECRRCDDGKIGVCVGDGDQTLRRSWRVGNK